MIKMGMFMRVNILMIRERAMGSFRWLMGITIKASGRMIYIMGMACSKDRMDIVMMVVGLMV